MAFVTEMSNFMMTFVLIKYKNMNIKLLLLITSFFFTFTVMSCTDNEDDNEDCSTANMSYTNDIRPILQNNGCLASGCHGGSAATNALFMDSYESLKIYVNAQRLIGAIKHQPGFSPMPKQSDKIKDCEIKKIEAWVVQGAKDN